MLPTATALRFVGAATFEALSGRAVPAGLFDDVAGVAHVRLGRAADLVLVAPATADLLARAATGRADDLLTATLLTATCPVVMAPAMHTEMWLHPATQANVATLRERGVLVVGPADGRLTGADSGPGRLVEPAELAQVAAAVLHRAARHGGRLPAPDLAGRRVVVSAGGTREPLDPVRYLGNRSSGRQGYALARAAALRGAVVDVVAAHVTLDDPAGARVHRVATAEELAGAMGALAGDADAVVMAAAVADFTVAAPAEVKVRRDGPLHLDLVATPDVLASLVAARPAGQVVVGFAAETLDDPAALREAGRAKLARKGCDLLVVNPVGAALGFEAADNAGWVLDRDGGATEVPRGPKSTMADAVWDAVAARLSAR